MKREMIKTTIVCLLLGTVIFAGSAFAAPEQPLVSVGGPGDIILPSLPPLPDLMPFSPRGSTEFCDISTHKPVIEVKNIGAADADFSISNISGVSRLPAVRLDFETSSGTVTKFYPPHMDVITSGGGSDVIGRPEQIDPPPDCFGPDCNFKITVNPGAIIDLGILPIPESDFGNNHASGRCAPERPECEAIRAVVAGLEDEARLWGEELNSAPTPVKPGIVRIIREIEAEINTLKRENPDCFK